MRTLKKLTATVTALGAVALTAVTPAITQAAPYRPPVTHLVQLYTRPQVLNWMDTVTISGACPDGGYLVQDPTNYLAVSYVPRASATNVFSTLLSGATGSGTISVSFNNGEQSPQIAAFEYTCRVPGPMPTDAPPLATLVPRRAHF